MQPLNKTSIAIAAMIQSRHAGHEGHEGKTKKKYLIKKLSERRVLRGKEYDFAFTEASMPGVLRRLAGSCLSLLCRRKRLLRQRLFRLAPVRNTLDDVKRDRDEKYRNDVTQRAYHL